MPSADPNPIRRLTGTRPITRRWQAAVAGPALVASPRPPSVNQRRRLLPVIAGSVLLHILVIAAFWLPSPEPPAELATPPGVSMVFDQGATTPTETKGPEPTPSAPMAAPSTPSPQPDETPPTPPAEPTPPTPAPQEPTPPVPEIPPTEPAPQTPPTPATTPQPTPPPTPDEPTEAPAIRFQSPESLHAFLVPPPVLIPQPQPMPLPPPQRPAPRVPAAPQHQASSFPHPMFNSLGSSFAGVPEGQRDQARAGGFSLQPFAQTSGTPLGAGWNELFRNWVESHKYYPRSAAELGQQGVVTVDITIQADGHVSDLHLVTRSGSPWLDMALQGMFRDAHVPPFPPGTKDSSVNYRVQMTYQLR